MFYCIFNDENLDCEKHLCEREAREREAREREACEREAREREEHSWCKRQINS